MIMTHGISALASLSRVVDLFSNSDPLGSSVTKLLHTLSRSHANKSVIMLSLIVGVRPVWQASEYMIVKDYPHLHFDYISREFCNVYLYHRKTLASSNLIQVIVKHVTIDLSYYVSEKAHKSFKPIPPWDKTLTFALFTFCQMLIAGDF
ncbi:hypothetical protein GJ496_002550 [Pomphorhynchus laevis]|nr:hypothetical protein GJ496_002550 [Pomphorhynchus laevis]